MNERIDGLIYERTAMQIFIMCCPRSIKNQRKYIFVKVKYSFVFVSAELGDYDPDEHLPDYISEIKLPAAVKGHEKEISSIHKTLE